MATSWSLENSRDRTFYGTKVATSQECPEKHAEPRHVILMGMLVLDRRKRVLVTKDLKESIFRKKPMIPYVLVENIHSALFQLKNKTSVLVERLFPGLSLTVEVSGTSPQFIHFSTVKENRSRPPPTWAQCCRIGKSMHYQPLFITMILVSAHLMPSFATWNVYWNLIPPLGIEVRGEKFDLLSTTNAALKRQLTGAAFRIIEKRRNKSEYVVHERDYYARYINRILRYISKLQIEFINNKPQLTFRRTYEREYGRSIDLEEGFILNKCTTELDAPRLVAWLIVGANKVYIEVDILANRSVIPCQKVKSCETYVTAADNLLASVQVSNLFITKRLPPVLTTILIDGHLHVLAIFTAKCAQRIGHRNHFMPKRDLFQNYQINAHNPSPRYLMTIFGKLITLLAHN